MNAEPTRATLHLLSAGAAFGLVRALAEGFEQKHHCTLEGTYGAVGAMREKLLAGAPCDVVLLTRKLIDELAREQRLDTTTVGDVGVVETGTAVISGDTVPNLSTASALTNALLGASGIFLPDMSRATAGIHMKSVFQRLGIFEQIGHKLHEYPNGATAMRTMAERRAPGSLGCTQLSEIIYTPGVEPAAVLPAAFSLDTVYSVAAVAGSASADTARALARLLCEPALSDQRQRAGFRQSHR